MTGWRSYPGYVLGSLLLLALFVACTPVMAPAGPAVIPATLQTAHLQMEDGADLPMRAWLPAREPARAVLIALHGFNDYSKFFEGAGDFLAARGLASYAYDQRGFGAAPHRGLWPGSATLIGDLRTAVRLIRMRHPAVPVYILGESMGGAVILAALAEPEPPDVDGAILVAPAVWGRSSMPWYQTTLLWLAVHTLPSTRLGGRGLGIVASDNTEMLRELGRDPLVIKTTRIDAVYGLVNLMDQAMASAPEATGRILLLYGARDQLIPPGAIDELLRKFPPETAPRRRFAKYANGYHMLTRDLQAETVWNDIAAWIEDAQAPLPSGADPNGRRSDGAAAAGAESSLTSGG